MLFSSNLFLFLFLPCVIVLYYILGKRFRNWLLLIASLLFYAWGEPQFVLVMIGSIIFNYFMALIIGKSSNTALRKAILAITVTGNLGILFIYKYLDFVIKNINALGFNIPLQNIVLPLGISFFTFQAMSYVIDVYRGTAKLQVKPQNVALYISFFPQLVAGPIVRYQTIADQIECRQETFTDFSDGVKRFIIGFAKKVLIANNMALVADAAFAMPDAERSVIYAWLGALAYAFQILFDFSGYSDMAIGMGKMFGFHFLENFDYPYISSSISEFWRRWHMSLGQWFRDYVYFPLGGSRVNSKWRLVFNLFVVWALTGVWHGASWNFIIWGLLYFVLIAFEKLTGYPQKFTHTWQKVLYRIFTLLCVLLGWVLFRALGAKAAVKYGLSMIGATGNTFMSNSVITTLGQYGIFFIIAILCSTPLFKRLGERIGASNNKTVRTIFSVLSIVAYIFILLWAVSYIMLGAHNPFIYFNF